MPGTPEAQARQEIDRLLMAAGWHVCGVKDDNIYAARGVAIREFPLDDPLCRGRRDRSQFAVVSPPVYNLAITVKTIDIIVTDEAPRPTYKLSRHVLKYTDAHPMSVTAKYKGQTFDFFRQNLVMEYSQPHSAADGVNAGAIGRRAASCY